MKSHISNIKYTDIKFIDTHHRCKPLSLPHKNWYIVRSYVYYSQWMQLIRLVSMRELSFESWSLNLDFVTLANA